ncbi:MULTISPECIES: hypothetical protein [unclassified Exiguobacterium]|uniref:hypothetical protein n=1 Tax=unclassified Exiguobacterium TaxID=2644629 RepID=UPI002036CE26|nr:MULTISPECIES: hypothetical protein [unclassified Exiguobacterium]
MTWWIDNGRALLFAPLQETYSFQFMDGPIQIAAKKVTGTEVELTLIEEDRPQTIMGTVTLVELTKALIKTSRQLINAADRNGWKNEEIDQLRHAVKSLQAY